MDFRETLASWFRPALQHPRDRELQAVLDTAWKAQMAEDYPLALETLDRALAIAHQKPDQAVEVVAQLHRSEIFMRQARYAEAEALNQQLLQNARGNTQRSYINTMIGMVAQAQGDWAGARAGYERALDDAREAGSSPAEARALGRLADVYLHDANASYAVHLLRDSLPKLGAAGDHEPSSYFTGLLGQALIQTGQDAEGQRLLERALRIAEQMGYRGYARHWAGVLGERALAEGRYQDAYTDYTRLLRQFSPETVSNEYASAVMQISKTCLLLRKPDEALSYALIAVKTAESLDDPALIQQARGALGIALRFIGRSAEAIPHLQAAVADQPTTELLRSLAAAQADSGDTDAAILTYRRAIQHAETATRPLEQAQARRDLGLVYHRRRELNHAITEWSAALAIYEEQAAHAQAARLYCDIGSARKALGQRSRAIREYEQALMLLNSLDAADQETRGLVLSSAANAYAEQGDAESADAFFTESISIANRLGDQVAESTRGGNYGWFLLLIGRPRRAINTLERALALSQVLKLSLQTAIQLDNLALVHDSLGDYATSLDYHQKALAIVDDPDWTAQIKVNLASTLISLNQLDEPPTLLETALAQGRETASSELIVAALTGLARLSIVQRQPEAADEPLAEAIALARRIENRRLLAEALAMRSQQQAALQRPDEAAAAWEEAQRLYLMLHMPQGKIQPAWLALNPTRS